MDKLQLPHAKLLYFVSELWKSNEIQNNEKLQLKEMIISDEPKVFKILDNYEATQNMYQLKSDIINLVRQPTATQPSLNLQNGQQVQQPKASEQQQKSIPESSAADKHKQQQQQQPLQTVTAVVNQQQQSQTSQQEPPVINVQQENANGVTQDDVDLAENLEGIEDGQEIPENYADIVNLAQLNDPSSPLGNYLINIKKAKPTGIKAIKDVLRPIKNSQQ